MGRTGPVIRKEWHPLIRGLAGGVAAWCMFAAIVRGWAIPAALAALVLVSIWTWPPVIRRPEAGCLFCDQPPTWSFSAFPPPRRRFRRTRRVLSAFVVPWGIWHSCDEHHERTCIALARLVGRDIYSERTLEV